MSRTLLTVLLAELAVVRVICRHQVAAAAGGTPVECGATVEVPIDRLSSVHRCPACNNDLQDPAGRSEFAALARALKDLRGVGRVSLEFVVPQPPVTP